MISGNQAGAKHAFGRFMQTILSGDSIPAGGQTARTSIIPQSNLRFHSELFSGYGDSLIDYDHRRTTLNLGLTLLDW